MAISMESTCIQRPVFFEGNLGPDYSQNGSALDLIFYNGGIWKNTV